MLIKGSLEFAVRDAYEQFQRLYERHTELVVILITSIIVALLVSILALPLQPLIKNIASALHMPEEIVYLLLTII